MITFVKYNELNQIRKIAPIFLLVIFKYLVTDSLITPNDTYDSIKNEVIIHKNYRKLTFSNTKTVPITNIPSNSCNTSELAYPSIVPVRS